MSTERMFWRGNNADGVGDGIVGPFLRQCDRPGALVIWWFEPGLDGSCDLLISRELTTDDPIRVRPGQWLALRGGWVRVEKAGSAR